MSKRSVKNGQKAFVATKKIENEKKMKEKYKTNTQKKKNCQGNQKQKHELII